MSRFFHYRRSRGFTLFYSASLILIIFLMVFGLTQYLLMTRRGKVTYSTGIGALQAAEAGIQKALYCLNATEGTHCGGTYGINYVGETDVEIESGVFNTTVTGSGTSRQIESTGTTYGGHLVKLVAETTSVPPTDEMSLGYALQSGDGGAYLMNGSVVNGTLYANGDVSCQTTQAVVDGDIYVAKTGGSIDSCQINYQGYADIIINSELGGDAYYRNDPADIAGTTVGGAKYPSSTTPAVEELPTPDLDFWRASAAAGGTISGDYNAADGESLGPVKIDGNLTFTNNATVTVTGPIWVAGNIITGNGTTIALDASFTEYSTVILADDTADPAGGGHVIIDNGTSVQGSGDPQSHIMFISTNQSLDETDAALDVANNSAGAVFLALDGVLRLRNNAGAKSLAAKRLWLDNNAEVTYVESDLADVKFSNSPGNTWSLTDGSWRQVD
ncbi:hypothetical protein AMJ57_05185 [Parcubacteria bacterium SG8_24]|nr:MAG: hypothetical protein AMJ57_05185 [Parcubacteria bacterium SG8_24]